MKQYKTVKNITKILIGFSVFCTLVVLFLAKANLSADSADVPSDLKPSSIMNVGTLLDRGLEFLEYFLGSMAFIGVMISGIQFGIAGGDPAKVAKAKNSLVYTALGIALGVLSFALVKSVMGMFE